MIFTCSEQVQNEDTSIEGIQESSHGTNFQVKYFPDGSTIKDRFATPEGFTRSKVNPNSFDDYLRNLPLKRQDAEVKFYDGSVKTNAGVYLAVVDMPIGKRNLHQCADAAMHLKSDFLWKQKREDEIAFNFTNGFRVEYSKWKAGNRIKFNGNHTSWYKGSEPSNTYETFWKYQEIIWAYAGTLSLEKELDDKALQNMKIGDLFIQGGSPGHAVIVVDMAENKATGKKVFMLAQSYMPAQEIQVLNNPSNTTLGPWFELDFGDSLITPEWNFNASDLHSFL